MIKTAEFVSRCHPDKVCDQIADYLLDRFLEQDAKSRVAIEVMGGHNKIFITGEVTSHAEYTEAELDEFVQFVLKDVGYPVIPVNFNIAKQSPEIARGVDTGGAGDQGIMYGYATTETPELLPLPYMIAKRLLDPYQDRDAKSQVTMDDNNCKIIVASISGKDFDTASFAQKLKIDGLQDAQLLLNPAGPWEVAGFDADTGLTGRKLGVDTYAGLAPHGGGAFSGKDPTKVDRSAAYMARYIAKWLIGKYGFTEASVGLAYAIGVAEPVMLTAEASGQEFPDLQGKELAEVIRDNFNLTPRGIIEFLDLQKPIYYETAKFGHFTNPNFPWEKIRKD
jgi:S-adenosylmethionine synthetase